MSSWPIAAEGLEAKDPPRRARWVGSLGVGITPLPGQGELLARMVIGAGAGKGGRHVVVLASVHQ